ncbi:sulfite exporter TauE/SafE family protein [Alcanivorax sp.]|uniref:sulfite exporter TauE/SafE family protein n=1 Tax=Alcanivorax sp. TaxID=1872427 RepID=UPI0025BA49BF|nr:sulfite exporter TauE/SafE family protein [Alcanivorax sp.]
MTPESLLALLASSALLAATGSIHCVGMCGGISSALTFTIPEQQRKGKSLWLWQAVLGLGRVSTYALLGLLAGALGERLLNLLPGPAMALGLALSGVLMLLLALHLAGKGGMLAHLERIGQGLWRKLQPLTKKLLPLDHPIKAYALGILWGFLPCGLVYTALALAATSGQALSGGLIMAVFGAITVIPVATTGVVASQLQGFRSPRARKLAVLLTLLLALGFLVMAWQMASGKGHGSHQHGSTPAAEMRENMQQTHQHHQHH